MSISRRTAVSRTLGALGAWAATHGESAAWPLAPPHSLEDIARRMEAAYPAITHTPPSGLAAMMAANARFLLADVREPDEYGVSHLAGAERVDPDAAAARVVAQLAARAAGGDVLFYCSVGQRSSRMAVRVRQAMIDHGARRVHNLRGGVFAWHNEARPLVDRFGATPYVHPYSVAWRRLLDRQAFTAFVARESG